MVFYEHSDSQAVLINSGINVLKAILIFSPLDYKKLLVGSESHTVVIYVPMDRLIT